MPVVLMVAEKPSLAKSLAEILSKRHFNTRKSVCGACPVHEYEGYFPPGSSRKVKFKMTSVCGHVMSLDFLPRYNSWEKTDPEELFTAKTIKKEAVANLHICKFLDIEARGVDYLVLWLDCDKEGENICYEVIDVAVPVMRQPTGDYQTVFRARFSAITEKEITRAMATLIEPDWNQSRSVDARQELDLRIGCAFTRFQTMYFQSKYSDLDSALISYGPCQTPTLGFCVQRHDVIQSFKPEKYWMIDCTLVYKSCNLSVDWVRQRLFDHEAATMFLDLLQQHQQAVVNNVLEKIRSKPPPAALNTVDMLRVASSQLHMGPQHVMHLAEKLYTQGYISYPRTETTKYPESFDFRSILVQFKSDLQWKEHVELLLTSTVKCPKTGKDVGDHPPITPMRCATRQELSGDSYRLYEYIVQHFIGSLLAPCQFKVTQVIFRLGDEDFTWSGTQPVSAGFTAAMPWLSVSSHTAQVELAKGQTWDVKQLKISEHYTSPPDYLTESELIGLMEKHGIGTDASIPVHIENISQRNYVKVDNGRKLIPTKLGIVLVHGYQKIDPELVLPTMRSAVEEQLNLIALGKADFDSVLQHGLGIFGLKFQYFRSNINAMDELFEASFTSVAEGGKPLSRCGRCNRFMRYISAKPQRLYCNTCDETYALPQGGTVKLYKELKCPLDGFELVIFSTGSKGKTFHLCPFCYNQPPFPNIPKGMGCNRCPHASCPHALPQLSVCDCTECEGGALVLDPASGPCWRLACNDIQCNVVASLCEGAHRVAVTDQCCGCGCKLVQIDFNKSNTPLADGSTNHIGCPFCDEVINSRMSMHHSVRGRGRGRGGHRHHRRGRGSSSARGRR